MLQHCFEIAGGSIPGRDHLGRNEILLGRNNQDAHGWFVSDKAIIGLVCDGCGSGAHSEVGAKLGVKLLLSAIADALTRSHPPEDPLCEIPRKDAFLEEVRLDVTAQLRSWALNLTMPGESVTSVVRNYLLFTAVGFLVLPRETFVFSIGDGLFALNGSWTQLGPFPDNAPPYLMYGIMQQKAAVEGPYAFTMHDCIPTDSVESLLLGSDGGLDVRRAEARTLPGSEDLVGPMSQFWTEDAYFQNPDAVRRRLSLMNREVKRIAPGTSSLVRESGLLRDDTTVVVLRRRKE